MHTLVADGCKQLWRLWGPVILGGRVLWGHSL